MSVTTGHSLRFLPGHRGQWLIVGIFGLIYALISIVNHYTFKTYAWDLGINNNAIWDYSHFRWNNCMLIDGPQFENILSDHLTFYPVFISPFIHIFGSYTMLVFQILAILWGGVGIFRCVRILSGDTSIANLGMIAFFSMWGIFSALGFDYHDNVVASMFMPWIYYYLLKENLTGVILCTVLLLLGKENMALWAVFIGLGLFLRYYSQPRKRWMSLAVSLVALVYFYVAVNVIIPSFSNAGRGYLHFHYAALGMNFKEALVRLLTDPIYVTKLLWVNHTGEIDAIGIKRELHIVTLLSGGAFLILRPSYFVMLLPIYAQKLFNDDFTKWGLNNHYSIEFAPVLALGTFDVISGIKRPDSFKVNLAIFMAVFTIVVTLWKIDNRTSKWYVKENVAFYSKMHYKQEFDISDIHTAIKKIPDSVSLKASEVLVPHLAFRETIYMYPLGPETPYIALLDHDRTFPLNRQRIQEEISRLKADSTWETIHAANQLYIFRKK